MFVMRDSVECKTSEIHQFAATDDIAKMASLLEHCDMHTPDEFGATPLHIAAANSQLAMVTFLLDQGADIECKNTKDGNTPLISAAKYDAAYEVIAFLLARGAEVNAVSLTNKSSLYHLSASKDSAAKIQLLLDHGANPRLGSSRDGYAIHRAVHAGNIDTVALLLSRGININEQYFFSRENLAFHAARLEDPRMLRFLIETGVDINAKDFFQNTVCHVAAKCGAHKSIKLLLERKAKCDEPNKDKVTPLMVALLEGRDQGGEEKWRKTVMLLSQPYAVKDLRKLQQRKALQQNRLLSALINLKERQFVTQLWQKNHAKPEFHRLLRLANIGLFATCKELDAKTTLPYDIQLKIAESHVMKDLKAARRFQAMAGKLGFDVN